MSRQKINRSIEETRRLNVIKSQRYYAKHADECREKRRKHYHKIKELKRLEDEKNGIIKKEENKPKLIIKEEPVIVNLIPKQTSARASDKILNPNDMYMCLICKQNFSSKSIGHHIRRQHNITVYKYYLQYITPIIPKCYRKECNNTPTFDTIPSGYRKYCSHDCLLLDMKNSKEFKHKHASTIKNGFIERFGVENPMQLPEVQEKTRNTMIDRYGVPTALQNPIIMEKLKARNLKTIGFENTFQTEKAILASKEQKRQIMIEKIFGEGSTYLENKVTPLFKPEEFINVRTMYKWRCNGCGKEFEGDLLTKYESKLPRCLDCYPLGIQSYAEFELMDYIKTFGEFSIKHNDRKILDRLELDIYVENLNLAIEFNGLYFHAAILQNKDESYHLHKTTICESKNIQLIHIFENEWNTPKINNDIKELIKNVILKNIIDLDIDNIGIIKLDNNELLLDRRFYNINSKFNKQLELIEILPPKKHFLNDGYDTIILEETEDWIWDCGYLKMKIL